MYTLRWFISVGLPCIIEHLTMWVIDNLINGVKYNSLNILSLKLNKQNIQTLKCVFHVVYLHSMFWQNMLCVFLFFSFGPTSTLHWHQQVSYLIFTSSVVWLKIQIRWNNHKALKYSSWLGVCLCVCACVGVCVCVCWYVCMCDGLWECVCLFVHKPHECTLCHVSMPLNCRFECADIAKIY